MTTTTATTASYDDGSPIDNEMRAADGALWWRTTQDRWTDGVMSGGWSQVAAQQGPMTPCAL